MSERQFPVRRRFLSSASRDAPSRRTFNFATKAPITRRWMSRLIPRTAGRESRQKTSRAGGVAAPPADCSSPGSSSSRYSGSPRSSGFSSGSSFADHGHGLSPRPEPSTLRRSRPATRSTLRPQERAYRTRAFGRAKHADRTERPLTAAPMAKGRSLYLAVPSPRRESAIVRLVGRSALR
jgi:hypothetical protein